MDGMDYLGEYQGLICKAKSLLSSLSGILLWESRLHPSPVHSPKDFPTHNCHLQLGFKTLIYLEAALSSPPDPNHFLHIVHSYMISSAPTSYSPELPSTSPSLLPSVATSTSSSLSSIMFDDLIGTESGFYLSSNEDDEIKGLEKSNGRKHDDKPNQRYRAAGTRSTHYPPPIPLLAQTGRNLPGRMPWVFTRHYGDGKLILKVERVKHHEYLEAHRENGRLILNLVLDLDDVEREEEMINHDDQELELKDLHDHFEDKGTDHEKIHDDQEVEIQYQEPVVNVSDDNYTQVDHDDEIVAEEDLTMTSLASSIPVKIWLDNGIMVGSKRYDHSRSLLKSSSTTAERSENLRKCFTNNADVFINPNAMIISPNALAHA